MVISVWHCGQRMGVLEEGEEDSCEAIQSRRQDS